MLCAASANAYRAPTRTVTLPLAMAATSAPVRHSNSPGSEMKCASDGRVTCRGTGGVQPLQVKRWDRAAGRAEQDDGAAHRGGGDARLERVGPDAVVDDSDTAAAGQIPHAGRQIGSVAQHVLGARGSRQLLLLVGGDRRDDVQPSLHRGWVRISPTPPAPACTRIVSPARGWRPR